MKKLTSALLLSFACLNFAAAQTAAPAGDVKEIVIKPDDVTGLKYSVTEFTVKAGEKVKITLDNNSKIPQPHNVNILKPGTIDEVGGLVMKMLTDPQGMAKSYIPETDKILYSMKLVQPMQKGTLEFEAPKEPGDYPYACTFPGHWTLMRGVMKVTN